MAAKYGYLLPTWQTDIKAGFEECMRVLKPNGILVFKWNERQIKLNELLGVIEKEPLYGNRTGKKDFTIWMTFLK